MLSNECLVNHFCIKGQCVTLGTGGGGGGYGGNGNVVKNDGESGNGK